MKTIDVIQGKSEGSQTLRLVLLLIIIATFPFYCLAVFIIGSAPLRDLPPSATKPPASDATFTPLGADQVREPAATITPLAAASITPLSSLPPTPRQFIPPSPAPTDVFVAQTRVSPSPIPIQPSATIAPFDDADGDGVADDQDSCPNEYGYADSSGCPYPDDPDRDRIRSDQDLCPREYAPNTPRGCRDFDDDGLDTSQDDCPQQAGPSDNRGCPLDDVSAGG